MVKMTIQDNGHGFDTQATYAGIGLSTMRERAETSGGTIIFESAPGKGARIEITLPITVMKDVMTISMDRITVMIVDDHEMVRRGACSYLEAQPDISVVAQAG
jgi:signal transduction histidine kinase